MMCLEVTPEVDEYETHSYTVCRDDLRLELTIFQYFGDVCISLCRDGVQRPVFNMGLIDCTGVRYVNDDRGEYLEFAPARCFGSRYDRESPIPYGIRLAVKPSIAISLF